MKTIIFIIVLCTLTSSAHENDKRTKFFPKHIEYPESIPSKENLWVFILAGQSNMAGRGLVEPQDTLPSDRILTINKNGNVVIAKEPIHFYEPSMTGLDCGVSFGQTLVKNLPDSISVMIIPTAVGGSSISQWLGDSIHRDIKLLSNFKEKVNTGSRYGSIKGILWHQGESDANEKDIPDYKQRLSRLFITFREIAGNEKLPVLIGELGSFSDNSENWKSINQIIKKYSEKDKNTGIISTYDLEDKGDKVHFSSNGQRMMGQRFANKYLSVFKHPVSIE